MRVQTAKSMSRLASRIARDAPDAPALQHVRDAARTLRAGREEAAQRHLRAAMFTLTPQSLMRNGQHTDDLHTQARDMMHDVHRHLLLVKDIADVNEQNQQNIRRASYGDDTSSPQLPHPAFRADPNNGYGPGALAQKPTARQPPGDQALDAPNRADGGGSDPAAAQPRAITSGGPRSGKQIAASRPRAPAYELSLLHHFNPGEARDAHGMWTHGEAAALAGDLSKSYGQQSGYRAAKLGPASGHVQNALIAASSGQYMQAAGHMRAAASASGDPAESARMNLFASRLDDAANRSADPDYVASVEGEDDWLKQHVENPRVPEAEAAQHADALSSLAEGMRAANPTGPKAIASRQLAVAANKLRAMDFSGAQKYLADASKSSGGNPQITAIAGKVADTAAYSQQMRAHGMYQSSIAASNPTDLAFHFNPAEHRDAHGKWTAGDAEKIISAIGKADSRKSAAPDSARDWQFGKASTGVRSGDFKGAADAVDKMAARHPDPQSASQLRSIAGSLRASAGNVAPAPARQRIAPPRAVAFTYDWDDLAAVVELVGKKGWEHGWRYVGGPGLPAPKPASPFQASGKHDPKSVIAVGGGRKNWTGQASQMPDRGARRDFPEVSKRMRMITPERLQQARDDDTRIGNGLAPLHPELAQIWPDVYGKAAGVTAAARPLPLPEAPRVKPDPGSVTGLESPQVSYVKAGIRQSLGMLANDGPAAELSAKTAALEVTPAPYGKPGGPGLYNIKGNKHSDYLEQVVRALMTKRGMDKGHATAIAYSALKKWRAGGGNVHPEVRAAATGALAEEKAKGAAARAIHGHATWADLDRAVLLAVTGPRRAISLTGTAAGAQKDSRTPLGTFGTGGSKPDAHQQHVAHVAALKNQQGKSAGSQKASKTAQITGLKKQLTALQAQQKTLQGELASASGATSSGQSGSTTSTGSSTTSSGSSTTASSAPAASTTASTTSSSTPSSSSSTTSSSSSSTPSAAQVATWKAQLAQVTAQIGQVQAKIKQLGGTP
jgi:hypothetical protein